MFFLFYKSILIFNSIVIIIFIQVVNSIHISNYPCYNYNIGDVMKRVFIALLIVLVITGCKNNDDVVRQLEIEFDNDYYQVAAPYKPSVSGNYVVNNVLNNYDVNDIENAFMMLSSNYFKTTNSLYQDGQYLSRDELKSLLSRDNLNNDEDVEINGIKIKPYYVSSIYEQNYLTASGNLKGVTIGLVINPYQAYETSYGGYDYEVVEIDVLKPIIFEKANAVVKYIRSKSELKDVKLLVGVYIQNRPNGMLPGGIKYFGLADHEKVQLAEINYEYQYLNSDYVLNNDINIYNAFSNLEKQIKKVKDTISVSAKGLYYNNQIQNIEINVYSGIFNNGELLYLCNVINNELGNFDNQVNIKVIIKSGETKVAFINKESNSLKSNVYILGG